ncbi:MAG: cytochrome c [Gallionellaceae bacterium]
MNKKILLASLTTLMAGLSSLAVFASDAEHGKSIYNATCAVCHGIDGTGEMPGVSDLTKEGGGLHQDDRILLSRMLNGYQDPGSGMVMPPRGGNPALTESDLKDVLQYMRREFQVSR